MDEFISNDTGGQWPPTSDGGGQGRTMADYDRQRPTVSEPGQNTAEFTSNASVGQWPPRSDTVGLRRTGTDSGRQGPTVSEPSREKHTLTTFEALKIFENNGLPRSQRSLERYCKGGKLDCFVDPDEQRYYITRESVERLIGHLKELAVRHGVSEVVGQVPPAADTGGLGRTVAEEQRQSPAPSNNMSAAVGQVPPGADTGGLGRTMAEERERRIKELEREKKELERENFDLKITNQAKEYLIDQYQKERNTFLDRISNTMRRIGVLETKLFQLGAPKEEVEERRVETTEDYTKF